MLNYYACLQEIKEEEIKCNLEVAVAYVEFSNVGDGLGGGFEDTNELKPMKYIMCLYMAQMASRGNRRLKMNIFAW